MKLTLYTDGGARPTNPGPTGFACLIVNEYGHTKHISRFIGKATNNKAEYMAVIVGVKMAAEEKSSYSDYDYLEIVVDSKLVSEGLHERWDIKNDEIRRLRNEALELLRKNFYDNWHVTQIRGHGKDKKDLRKKKRDLAFEHGDMNEYVDRLCTSVISTGIRDRRASNPWLQKAGIR